MRRRMNEEDLKKADKLVDIGKNLMNNSQLIKYSQLTSDLMKISQLKTVWKKNINKKN